MEGKAIYSVIVLAHCLFVARTLAHLFLRSWVQILSEIQIFSSSHAGDVLSSVSLLFHSYLSQPGMLQDFNLKTCIKILLLYHLPL